MDILWRVWVWADWWMKVDRPSAHKRKRPREKGLPCLRLLVGVILPYASPLMIIE